MRNATRCTLLLSVRVFVILILLASPLFCQDSGLFIAEVNVNIGMSKTDFVTQLRKDRYQLMERPGKERYIVATQKPSSEIIGTIDFEAGKVSSVSRDWGTYRGEEALGFGETIFALLSNMTETGQKIAVVKVDTVRVPKHVIKFVTLQFGKKQVSILLAVEGEAAPQVTISEYLNKLEEGP